jgi:RNA polymerase sigma factor (sigma-70 family)
LIFCGHRRRNRNGVQNFPSTSSTKSASIVSVWVGELGRHIESRFEPCGLDQPGAGEPVVEQPTTARHPPPSSSSVAEETPPPTEHHDLSQALGRLTDRQREAVVLRYWDDLDLAGCADAIGVSVGSVKTHLSRAHETLRNTTELTLEEI